MKTLRLPLTTAGIALALTVATAIGALAQPPRPGQGQGQQRGQGGQRRGGGLPIAQLAELDLSSDQKVKLFDLMVKQTKMRATLRDTPEDKRREKMAEMNKTLTEELMKVLTPEQQAKFKAASSRGGERKRP